MKKLKRPVKILMFLLVFLLVFFLSCLIYYNIQISPVSNDDATVEIEIGTGTSTSMIGDILIENNLIRDKFVFSVYIKLNNIDGLQAGTYQLSEAMSLSEILDYLSKGVVYGDSTLITFKEGWTLERIGQELEKSTLITTESFLDKMSDDDYILSLIDEYWFLDEVIMDSDIYYPLEGYLFPETYAISDMVEEEDVIKIMLDQMNLVLSEVRGSISESKFTVHEILSLASMIELEGVDEETRNKISGVFYNRLEDGWSLGSDVTTCYGVGASLSDCNDNIDYNAYTPYNTRSIEMAGKLPIGPICSPGLESITASLFPDESDNYYFVADKYKNVFFTRNEIEHQAMIKEIKDRGDWPW